MTVQAAVGSAPELLDAVRRARPDAVLTDIRMPANPAAGLAANPAAGQAAGLRPGPRWKASTRHTALRRPLPGSAS